jgi:5-methylcytosine-specific restriction endonuclease McrA
MQHSFLLSYLESQFTTDINWENYGIYWEIDHIKPLSKGGSFHYTNTQPLTISENLSKSNSDEELSTFR